ncbi:MAG: T9SS type A sorting domain-containing protein [Bacteroidetes bacterium]|nr:MAG: T9SS type A sorting domain-containing protein [Bacteroidota bacterium]
MKNYKIKYLMSLLMVMLVLPIMNYNLYCDHGDGGDGHGHGNVDVKVTGTITAITLFSITVDSTEFAVNSDTKIKADGNIGFDLLQLGDTVKVEGNYIDSVLTATEIKLLTNGDDNGDEDGEDTEFEVKGLITDLSDSALTVNGQNILMTDSTVIRIEGQDSASKSDLSVGLMVEVEGNIVDSTYYAQKIKIESEGEHHNGQEFEISGTVSAIGADNFTIDTLTIYVDSNTGVVKEHAGVISFADLAVGDSVRVKGTIDSNGLYTAEKVKVIVNEQLKVEEEGLISDVTDSTITVNISTFVITADTRIRKGDSTVDKTALTVGEQVHVKGMMTDSNLIAIEIKIQNDDNHNDSLITFELKGAIESINNDSVTVDGTTFLVDSNTMIKMEGTGLILLSDLTIGMNVEVHGTIVNDVYIASKIEVSSDMSEDTEIKGEITAIQDSTFTVNNTVITVTAETMIYDKDRNTLSFADLSVGNFVKVKLNIVDSSNFALEVKVKENHSSHSDSDEVSSIDIVTETNFTANNKTFAVDGATQVFDQYGNQIAYSELKQSMKVYIYEDIKNNQLYASRIDVLQAGVSDVTSDVSAMIELVNEPNPFSDATTLKLIVPNDGNIECALYNESGRKVLDIYNGFAGKGENDFVITENSNLATGTYYINVFYNGSSYTRAVIKIK